MPVPGGMSRVASVGRPVGFDASPQQQAVFDWIKTPEIDGESWPHAILDAVAGSGKTTTLAHACKLMKGSIVFLVFNKKNVGDIEKKLQSLGIGGVTVSTFHSAGFKAWRTQFPRVQMNDRKMDDVMNELAIAKRYRSFVNQAVSIAKQSLAYIVWQPSDLEAWDTIIEHNDLDDLLDFGETETQESRRKVMEEAIDAAVRCLDRSIELNEKVIDFGDMIYAPLLAGSPFQQYPWVLVDEAQDTNAARRMMASRMLAPNGRFLAVGDQHQAIYGFTGADNDSLDLIQDRFDCTRLPLTVTYRCAKSIVRMAQRYVPHIEAHPGAPEGIVRTIKEREFKKLNPVPGEAILCRNTRPLVEIAFDLIRRRIPCHVEGKEIGQGLIRLIKRFPEANSCAELRIQLEDHVAREIQRLSLKNRDDKIESLKDQVETIYVMIESLPHDASRWDLISSIEDLFKDTSPDKVNSVVLSTVHKSKGREWKKVYLIGRNRYMPSRFAKQDWQLQQERNLIYVAVTRAMDELVEVVVPMPGDPEEPEAASYGMEDNQPPSDPKKVQEFLQRALPDHVIPHLQAGAVVSQRDGLTVVDYRTVSPASHTLLSLNLEQEVKFVETVGTFVGVLKTVFGLTRADAIHNLFEVLHEMDMIGNEEEQRANGKTNFSEEG